MGKTVYTYKIQHMHTLTHVKSIFFVFQVCSKCIPKVYSQTACVLQLYSNCTPSVFHVCILHVFQVCSKCIPSVFLNTVGIHLEYTCPPENTLGIQVGYAWNTVGINLEYTWNTLGIHFSSRNTFEIQLEYTFPPEIHLGYS